MSAIFHPEPRLQRRAVPVPASRRDARRGTAKSAACWKAVRPSTTCPPTNAKRSPKAWSRSRPHLAEPDGVRLPPGKNSPQVKALAGDSEPLPVENQPEFGQALADRRATGRRTDAGGEFSNLRQRPHRWRVPFDRDDLRSNRWSSTRNWSPTSPRVSISSATTTPRKIRGVTIWSISFRICSSSAPAATPGAISDRSATTTAAARPAAESRLARRYRLACSDRPPESIVAARQAADAARRRPGRGLAGARRADSDRLRPTAVAGDDGHARDQPHRRHRRQDLGQGDVRLPGARQQPLSQQRDQDGSRRRTCTATCRRPTAAKAITSVSAMSAVTRDPATTVEQRDSSFYSKGNYKYTEEPIIKMMSTSQLQTTRRCRRAPALPGRSKSTSRVTTCRWRSWPIRNRSPRSR